MTQLALAMAGHRHWTLAFITLPIGFGLIVGAAKMVGAWMPSSPMTARRRSLYRGLSPLMVGVGAGLVTGGFTAG